MNESKSKIIKITRMVYDRWMNVILNGELLEEVEGFTYLRSHIAVDRGIYVEGKS